jgi:hypothetical protein
LVDRAALLVGGVALGVSLWLGWTSNRLAREANEISGTANQRSEEALRISNEGATATVSVTGAAGAIEHSI